MSSYQSKRKPFQGKQKHKDLREFKNQEIKKSLVHRARLRKNYFKLIENEGQPTDYERLAEERDQEAPQGIEEEHEPSKEDADRDGGGHGAHVEDGSRSATPPEPQPPQGTIGERDETQGQRQKKGQQVKARPLNFAERARVAKERKMHMKDEQLRKVQQKRRNLDLSQRERERKKERLSQRTRSGQPVMGPKINHLLEKIRRNEPL